MTMNNKQQIFLLSIINILTLIVIILGVSIYFMGYERWTGLILIFLAGLCVATTRLFKISLRSLQPDIIFGLIDNGILALMAIFGGHWWGVAGAILGGVVGNAVTDGIAGIFEGYTSENLGQESGMEQRTMLKSAVGKMAGCLLGAGIVMTVAQILNF